VGGEDSEVSGVVLGRACRPAFARIASVPAATTNKHATDIPASVARSPVASASRPTGHEAIEFTPNAIIVTAITRPR
jgi:hypothetical protein